MWATAGRATEVCRWLSRGREICLHPQSLRWDLCGFEKIVGFRETLMFSLQLLKNVWEWLLWGWFWTKTFVNNPNNHSGNQMRRYVHWLHMAVDLSRNKMVKNRVVRPFGRLKWVIRTWKKSLLFILVFEPKPVGKHLFWSGLLDQWWPGRLGFAERRWEDGVAAAGRGRAHGRWKMEWHVTTVLVKKAFWGLSESLGFCWTSWPFCKSRVFSWLFLARSHGPFWRRMPIGPGRIDKTRRDGANRRWRVFCSRTLRGLGCYQCL